MIRKLLTACFVALAAQLTAVEALSQPQGDVVISRANVAPIAIAAPMFTGSGPHGDELAQIIRNNLGRSGLFSAIDPLRYIEPTTDFGNAARVDQWFQSWRLVGAQYLVTGTVSRSASGLLSVDFRLWDVNSKKEMTDVSTHFEAPEESWRRIGHQISDKIYSQLTGLGGYFDTRIAFVSESGPKTQKRRRLTLMDQDGYNPIFLTGADATDQIYTPRFSRSAQQIAYMALRDSGSQLYLIDLETGRPESLGRFDGMAVGPRFSPDGSRVVFSIMRRGNTDVFITDVRNAQVSQLTADPSIDASPSFSPDGKLIVFNSNRAGSPQLYVMNADGSGQRRLSTGSGRYTTPVWSPDAANPWIAFTKQTGNTFHIGIMRPDGTDERLLTESYLDEGPSWAPNGQVIIFTREAGPGSGPRLWTVDLTGRILQPAPHSLPGADPGWSPMLK